MRSTKKLSMRFNPFIIEYIKQYESKLILEIDRNFFSQIKNELNDIRLKYNI